MHRLTLYNLHCRDWARDNQSLLFDQHLPSLRHLSMGGFVQQIEIDGDHCGVWEYGPSVDRERVRALFSRLASFKLSWHNRDIGLVRCPALLDAAHPKLRRIKTPQAITANDLYEIFNKCSPALSVVCLHSWTFAKSKLEDFARQFTGLRALSFRKCLDAETFKCLMELRGPQLIALQLGKDNKYLFTNYELVQLVADFCRSLEYLSVSLSPSTEQTASIERDLLNLVQQCGLTLRYFALYLRCPECFYYDDSENDDSQPGWATLTATLIRAIADCWPLLRGLKIHLHDFWDVNDWVSDLREALTKLLRNCPHLRTLQLDFEDYVDYHKRCCGHKCERRKIVNRKRMDWTQNCKN
ncbi:hypothetical protein HK102_011509 [Quaeritorhiza haematococci]|nr:hypothetical protein HK102_011509 [Quaeritorhiza haematococci]